MMVVEPSPLRMTRELVEVRPYRTDCACNGVEAKPAQATRLEASLSDVRNRDGFIIGWREMQGTDSRWL